MHAHSYNDKELFRQIAEGDESAFRLLFHRYSPEFRSLVLHITKTTAVADDILQEIFLQLWLSRDQLPGIENPRSWLLRMLFNRSVSYLRKQAVHHKAVDAISSRYAADEMTSSTEELLTYTSMVAQIGSAVAQLPPQAKRIYLLSRETGLKIPEIAAQLSLSPSTVKNSLVRSLQFIRKHLEASGHLFSLLLIWLLGC